MLHSRLKVSLILAILVVSMPIFFSWPFVARASVPISIQPSYTIIADDQSFVCPTSIFEPNPIASSNDTEIINYLSAVSEQLHDSLLILSQSPDKGVIEGQWATLISDSGQTYLNKADCSQLKFDWKDYRFAYVTTYAAIQRATLWLSQIGSELSPPKALKVIISETEPSSQYNAQERKLIIGAKQCRDGSCPCNLNADECPKSSDGRPIWSHAQDSDIVLHEYGHAYLHHLICGNKQECMMPTGQQVVAMDEAFADYFATAINYSVSGSVSGLVPDSSTGQSRKIQTRKIQKNDPFCFGEWYNSIYRRVDPCLRRLDSNLHWPEAAKAMGKTIPYSYASIWASTLTKARFQAGRQAGREGALWIDNIVFQAYKSLHNDMTFEEMATTILNVAKNIRGGQYESTFRFFLRRQGFLTDLNPITNRNDEFNLIHNLNYVLNSEILSAFPTFDDTHTVTISGAGAIQLEFQDIRLLKGNCIDEKCGRIYISDKEDNLYEVIDDRKEKHLTKIVPGDTIRIRFVATYNHLPRTINYRLTGVRVYGINLYN